MGIFPGEYVKLQDAFVSEKGDKIGNWYAIGYEMHSNNNFQYESEGTAVAEAKAGKGNTGASKETPIATGITNAWGAMNKAALNDCVANAAAATPSWQIDVEANATSGGSVTYKATALTGCDVLTPNFESLTTAKSAP